MHQADHKEHIEMNSGVRFGKPIIRGTRIAVDDVLQWLDLGLSHEEILMDFPQLTEAALLACTSYAADH